MTSKEQQEMVDSLTEIHQRAAKELHTLRVNVLGNDAEVGMLRSENSSLFLLLGEVGKVLGHTGPVREMPDFAKKIMANLK